jgi:hypothetical protein
VFYWNLPGGIGLPVYYTMIVLSLHFIFNYKVENLILSTKPSSQHAAVHDHHDASQPSVSSSPSYKLRSSKRSTRVPPVVLPKRSPCATAAEGVAARAQLNNNHLERPLAKELDDCHCHQLVDCDSKQDEPMVAFADILPNQVETSRNG